MKNEYKSLYIYIYIFFFRIINKILSDFDLFCSYFPIAISLGSYMDKAAGRRACTGKKFTQDVSVLSR